MCTRPAGLGPCLIRTDDKNEGLLRLVQLKYCIEAKGVSFFSKPRSIRPHECQPYRSLTSKPRPLGQKDFSPFKNPIDF